MRGGKKDKFDAIIFWEKCGIDVAFPDAMKRIFTTMVLVGCLFVSNGYGQKAKVDDMTC